MDKREADDEAGENENRERDGSLQKTHTTHTLMDTT